jgi:hypothetical protein
MIQIIALLMICFTLTGCAGPFMTFYQDKTGGTDLTKSTAVILPTGEPKMFRGNDKNLDAQRMLEEGYNLVGFSSFNDANVYVRGALIQAKRVHAETVLIYSKYTGTVSGVMPLTLPETQTSTTTFSGSGVGSSGYSSFSGTANTTTYGTQTTYIPYSTDRYDYLATYWIKMKPSAFGVNVRELTAELRQQVGSNKGVHVLTVIKNSPAWKADILTNDIIRKMSNVDIVDPPTFTKAVRDNVGKTVTVEIVRDSRTIVKEVMLNNGTGYLFR